MRDKKNWPHRFETKLGPDGGFFQFPFEGRILNVIASHGLGWDHVSVSLANRCPNWREMCYIKDLFWHEDEVVVQYHPAKKDYVNNHNYCLHMWKPQTEEIPVPPSILVGII
jgi:hypothetical protein